MNYLANFAVAAIFLAISLSAARNALGDAIFQDAEYRVEQGQVVRVESGRVRILVDEFVMEDDGRMEFFDDTPLLFVHARRAIVGNGAEIIARARDGVEPGSNGKQGPTVVLIFEDVEKVSGLIVRSIGGDGAPGANGHPGRPGRPAECAGAGAGNGHRGGDGGPGGDGGHGGKIFLVLPSEASGYGISVITQPGEGGRGGKGGAGGPGGRGKEKCGIWPYWKRGSGNNGPPGRPGIDGLKGESGLFRTYPLDDFEENALVRTLEKVIETLREGEYGSDAQALDKTLNAVGLRRN